MKKITWVALSLCAFTAISIALVGGVKQLTQPSIAYNIRQVLIDKLNELIDPSQYDNDIIASATQRQTTLHGSRQTITLYQATQKNQHIAYLIQHTYPKGYSGDIVLLTGVDNQGKLLGIRVIQHQETPGLGDKIDIKKSNWIYQFNGLSIHQPSRWQVRQEGGDFDALTAATVTSKAIISAAYDVLNYVQNELTLTDENQ